MRRIALLFGLVLLAAPFLLADEPPDNYYDEEYAAETAPAPDTTVENKTLGTILVIDEFKGEHQSTEKLPAEVRFIADALKLDGASYTLQGTVLKVGYDEPLLVKGVQLARIVPQSDCPNNTQFHVTMPLVKSEALIKRAVTAWTQIRHRSQEAPLIRINTRQLAANRPTKNYDVQIDLNKVAVVIRE